MSDLAPWEEPSTAWFEEAACHGIIRTDPETWRSIWEGVDHKGALIAGTTLERNRSLFVQSYCHRCPVKAECRAYGVGIQGIGIFGGEYINYG